jgi:DNA repair protein RadC
MSTTNNLMSCREVKLKYILDSGILKRKEIQCAHDATMTLLEGFDKDTMAVQEQFVVLLLNRRNCPIGIYKASTGGITGTIVDIRLVMAVALKSMATSIILAHNHPSGALIASEQDKRLTKRFKEACGIMDILLMDHIIVSPNHDYYSFTNEGLL